MIIENYVFAEKYRPKTVADTILPERLKAVFQSFVDKGDVTTNLILTGKAGVGKTTIAKAMLEEIGCDYIVINGSLNASMDVLRTDITEFASSVSFSDKRKYVIIDEADYLNHNVQPALRSFMEEFSDNCGFILTCNYLNKIIEPLQSRCSVVEFSFSKEEQPDLASQMFKRVCGVLKAENIEYDKSIVVELIKQYFPDFRKILNEVQRYGSVGKIDSSIFVKSDITEQFNTLVKHMKDKNYTSVRKWVSENLDKDSDKIFRMFYDNLSMFKKSFIPILVITIAKYSYQSAFVADAEVNISAFLAETMLEAEWE